MSALTTIIDNNSSNNDESHEDKSMDVFEQFLKYRKKKASRKKCTNYPVHEATRLTEEIQRKNGEPKKCTTKNSPQSLMGGAIGLKGNSIANAPPPKKKKKENPLKKELSNPQGLDFANQAGALMAQPQKVEMLPPKDITKEST